MRGARPELKVIDGDAGNGPAAGPLNSTEEVGLSNATHGSPFSPPLLLPAEHHPEWIAIVADLTARRLWKDSMASIVTSFVLAQAAILRLEIKIAAEGESVAGAGGAQKPHPATGLLRSSRETAARLGAELGLTPTARSRKSLQPEGQGNLFESGGEWDL